jgi:2-phosphosulfolactate phosphatase
VLGAPSTPASKDIADVVRACASGVELVDSGFDTDVEIAARLDASSVVPVLRDGAFRAARP